eukprot:1959194-Pyramimonas_sp.AAC.1
MTSRPSRRPPRLFGKPRSERQLLREMESRQHVSFSERQGASFSLSSRRLPPRDRNVGSMVSELLEGKVIDTEWSGLAFQVPAVRADLTFQDARHDPMFSEASSLTARSGSTAAWTRSAQSHVGSAEKAKGNLPAYPHGGVRLAEARGE